MSGLLCQFGVVDTDESVEEGDRCGDAGHSEAYDEEAMVADLLLACQD